MKKIIITCDLCKVEIGEEHIKLGSETDDLYFENNLGKTEVGEMQSLGRYSDLHFCSKQHFINYFFDRP